MFSDICFFNHKQGKVSLCPSLDYLSNVIEESAVQTASLQGCRQLSIIRREEGNFKHIIIIYNYRYSTSTDSFGVCLVFKDYYPCGINYLFSFMGKIIAKIVREGKVLYVDKRGFIQASNSDIKRFSAVLKQHVDHSKKEFNRKKAELVILSSLSSNYYSIYRNQTIVHQLSDDSWAISEDLEYNNIVIITEEIEEENINSMRSFIKKSNETVDDLNKKIKKLEEQLKKAEKEKKKQPQTKPPHKQSNKPNDNGMDATVWITLGVIGAIILLNVIAPWFIPSVWPKLAVALTGLGMYFAIDALVDETNNKTTKILGWSGTVAILLSTVLTIYGLCGGFSPDTVVEGGNVQTATDNKMALKNSENKKEATIESTLIKSNHTASKKITSINSASNSVSKPSIPSNYVLVAGGHLSYNGNYYEDYKKHNVDIDSFYISVYELTQGEYERVMGGLRKFNYQWLLEDSWYVDKGPIYNEVKGENIPVRGSLRDFAEYCNKRSTQEGFDGFYIITKKSVKCKENSNGYRLVTPYEWIYAAYGGRKNIKQKYLGGKSLSEVAWHLGNSKSKPHSVGLKKPNIIGLFDMQGNAPEILQGDNKNVYYVSMMGGYNISNWNYDQTYDITYIRGNNKESDLIEYTYGTRIVFIPRGLQNRNLKRNYKNQ